MSAAGHDREGPELLALQSVHMIKTQFVHQAELGLDPFIEEASPRRFHEIAIGQAAVVGINHINKEVIDAEIEAGSVSISSRRSEDRGAELAYRAGGCTNKLALEEQRRP